MCVWVCVCVCVCVRFWKTRHVLSISACVQTAFPPCNQNRCIWGPFMCGNVWKCVCVYLCVCARVCMHPYNMSVFHRVCVYMFACLCNSFPICLFSHCPCDLFHVCLSAYKCIASVCVSVCVWGVCVCVRARACNTFTNTVHSLSQTWKDREKKTHFNRGQFRVLSHDLLVSKSNAMI